jgi:hypothetical protein
MRTGTSPCRSIGRVSGDVGDADPAHRVLGLEISWRGEIKFDTAEEWDRFFTDYETWIVEMARLAEAHGAAVFCVGLEYTHAQKFEQRWRKIIAAVRSVYSGKITYGANWGDYDAVKFWDAVDYLGVLAYFPLTTATNPSAEQIATGWRKRCAELQRFSDSHGGKKFLFVEVGYNENAEPRLSRGASTRVARMRPRSSSAASTLRFR